MRFLNSLVLACVCLATSAIAQPASERTMKELFEVTQTKKLLDGTSAQLDGLLQATVQESLKGSQPTPQQQKIIQAYIQDFQGVMREAMSWETMEPTFMRMYQETFTEEEVVGMLDFYKTPAGQALIKKMPLLMQQIMQQMPKMMADMQPKLAAITKKYVSEMARASGKAAKP